METTKEGLIREINVWGLSAHIINIMVGASIFVMPAIVAEGLGSAGITAYLFCGFLIMLIMLCFAEVGSKITSSGGAYTYIEVTLGKYAGFLAAVLFLVLGITSDAAIANAIVDILSSVFPLLKEGQNRLLFFLILFSGLAWINIVGIKQGIRLVKLITVAKLMPLILIILLCWKDITFTNLHWESAPSFASIGEIAIILFFSFTGGEASVAVSGEVLNPQKTIPRAIIISIVVVVILYILIQTVAQGVLGASLPTFKDSPLGEVARQGLGPYGFTLITVGMAVSAFGTVSGDILSVPRVIFGAARDNLIPLAMLAKVHKRFATPFVAIILYAGFSLILASIGGFKQLAILSSTSCLLIYLGVALSFIKLRKSNKRDTDSFRIPGGYIIPALSILIIMWLLSHLTKKEMIGISVFLSLMSLIYMIIYFNRKIKIASNK